MTSSNLHSRNNKTAPYRLAYFLIILGAFFLRIRSLDARSLWLDESIEYYVAGAPAAELLQTAKIALRDPPAYSLFLHFWLNIGQCEFVMRFPSIIFSISGIIGSIAFTKMAFGKKASLLTGLFMALSIADIRYAQEAGQYALMVGLLPWNLIGLYQLIRHNKWKWAILWGITTVLLAYSFYSAAITILMTTAISLMMLGFVRRWNTLWKLVLVAILCGILILALALDWVPAQIFSNSATKTLQISFDPLIDECQRFLVALQDYLVFQITGSQLATLAESTYVILAASITPLLLILIVMMKYRKHIVAWWFVLGLCGYYITGRLGAIPFGYRYSLNFVPLFWSCLAAGIIAILTKRTVSARNALAVLLTVMIVIISLTVAADPEEDLRSVARTWRDQRQSDDVTYVYYGAVPAFRYHLEQLGMVYAYPPRWYADCFWNRPGDYCAQDGVIYGRWLRGMSPEEKQAAVVSAVGESPGRLWLVFTHIYGDEEATVLSYFDETFAVTAHYPYEGSALYLLENR